MEDTCKSGQCEAINHTMSELDAVRKVLNPVAVRQYTEEAAEHNQTNKFQLNDNGELQCLHAPTFSYQLWTIKECFQMVWEYEQKASLTYTWVVRTRPDVVPKPHVAAFIMDTVLKVSDPE